MPWPLGSLRKGLVDAAVVQLGAADLASRVQRLGGGTVLAEGLNLKTLRLSLAAAEQADAEGQQGEQRQGAAQARQGAGGASRRP